MSKIIKTFIDKNTSIKSQTSISKKKLGIEILEITEVPKKFSIDPSESNVCRIVEFSPNIKKTLMHQTSTIDYGIILDGEIDLILKDDIIHLEKGDCFIQNSSEHAWSNKSENTCKIFFVMVPNER